MSRLVPFLLLSGAVLGVAGIVFALSGETVLGLALLAVGIADAAIARITTLRTITPRVIVCVLQECTPSGCRAAAATATEFARRPKRFQESFSQ